MITVVLTNRNRDLKLVKCCLTSLKVQINKNFKIVVIDYGSSESNLKKLEAVASQYPTIKFLFCNTQGQLWCKSRAINIVLKQCDTSSFFVGDIDMIYHPSFIERLYHLKNEGTNVCFQVGFLSESESNYKKIFDDYQISFKSSEEATGMTLFNTETLKSINGYDEFYHGWGSEDSDVHERLKNAGYCVNFYNDAVLILHQWHPKNYRNKNDLAPFHSALEQINQAYLKFSKATNKTQTNLNFPWGVYNLSDYNDLKRIDKSYNLTNIEPEIKGFINNVLLSEKNKVIEILIQRHEEFKSIKQRVKKMLGKKTRSFLCMDVVNNLLLECIVTNLRDKAYRFQYDSTKQTIHLIIKL